MSFPPSGTYKLRYIDPQVHGQGPLVATVIDGRHIPIKAAPEVEEYQDNRTWEVRRVGEDEFHILYTQERQGNIGFHYDAEQPDASITLSYASKFRLEQSESKPDIWVIRAAGNWRGVDPIVGLNLQAHDETLAINPYPIGAAIPLPAWRFEPA